MTLSGTAPSGTAPAPVGPSVTGPSRTSGRHRASPSVQARPTTDRRWWALAALCLSVLLVGIDNTIVNVALPTIGRELSAGISDLQWVVDGYTLVFATLLLVAGHLGDRFGRRRMLQAGLVIFALTSIGTSFATGTTGLIAGRAAMGVGAALIYPATLALLMAIFTDVRQRATAIGIWSGVSGLSVALGPVGGGLLVEHFDWAAVFWVNVPIAAIALLAGRFLLIESRDPQPGRFDPIGALASMAGIGLLVWSIIEAPGHGWGSTITIGGLAGAIALLAAFVVWEMNRQDPLFDVTLFANARFSAASGAIAAAFFGLFGFIFLITQYFQLVRGYGVLQAGVATLPFALVTGALSPVAIAAMKRLGTTAVVATGLALMSVGFVLAAGSSVDSAYWGRIVAAMALMAAGLAFTAGPATEAIMGALPPQSRRGGIGGQRHHPRDRRHARGGDRRIGDEFHLRLEDRRGAAGHRTSGRRGGGREPLGDRWFPRRGDGAAGPVRRDRQRDRPGIHVRAQRGIVGSCRGDRGGRDRGCAVPPGPAPRAGGRHRVLIMRLSPLRLGVFARHAGAGRTAPHDQHPMSGHVHDRHRQSGVAGEQLAGGRATGGGHVRTERRDHRPVVRAQPGAGHSQMQTRCGAAFLG